MMILKKGNDTSPFKFYIYFLHKEHKTSHFQDCCLSSECRKNGWAEIHQIFVIVSFLSRAYQCCYQSLFFFFFIYTMLCVVRKGDGDAHVDWFVFWRRFLTCGWCSSGCTAEEKNRGRVITQGECAFETAIVPVNNALSAEHAPLYLQTEMNERRLSAPLCRILWWNFNQRPEDVFIRRERCQKTSVRSPAGRFQ